MELLAKKHFTKVTINGRTSVPWQNFFGFKMRVLVLSVSLYTLTGILNERGSHTINVKSIFYAKTSQINVAAKWRNNGHSAKVRL